MAGLTNEQNSGAGSFSPDTPKVAEPTASFAAKATDLEALRTAVVDAAGVSTGLWLSYLFVLFYLAIAAAGVTHRDLLLENPVKLPFLNVDLPLQSFFFLGPVLFLIAHAYVLLHFVMLGSKVRAFRDQLKTQVPQSDGTRGRLRLQLPSNIFVQLLAGPREIRDGVMGFTLQRIARITLVYGPLLLLALFQLQFLAYHSWITGWQRFAFLADIVLLWTFWPAIIYREKTTSTTCRTLLRRLVSTIDSDRTGITVSFLDLRVAPVAIAMFASLVAAWIIVAVVTFPGEWLNRRFAQAGPLYKLLLAGDLDLVSRKPTSLWSNVLVVPGIDVIDHAKFDTDAKIARAIELFTLRNRRLEGAIFINAHLQKTDFTGAQLQGAVFDRADLREAKFDCEASKAARTEETGRPTLGQFGNSAAFIARELSCAQLQGAQFNTAQLQGASFTGARLQGASFYKAQLQGASFGPAAAQLSPVASIDNTDFPLSTQLQGAYFVQANLQGAAFTAAELEGANLVGAQLQGADLSDARLFGAVVTGADLEGALLVDTQLQGAVLAQADLGGALFDKVLVWRANLTDADYKRAKLDSYKVEPVYVLSKKECTYEHPCIWSIDAFNWLKQRIEEDVPAGLRRTAALRQIEQSLNPSPQSTPVDQTEIQAGWTKFSSLRTSTEQREGASTAPLIEAGCDTENGKYVIVGFLRNFEKLSWSNMPASLPSTLLDEQKCPAIRSVAERYKVQLRQIRDSKQRLAEEKGKKK